MKIIVIENSEATMIIHALRKAGHKAFADSLKADSEENMDFLLAREKKFKDLAFKIHEQIL